MKKLFLAALLLMFASPAMAQVRGDANFPNPAAGEFGPQVAIDDNLVLSEHLVGAAVTHTTGEMSPDTVGAFRFVCSGAQVLADDPTVYPGKPGFSHAHQFYGNTGANANSTYASYRTTGLSTCQNPLNRSAYWVPAIIVQVNGKTMVQKPEFVSVYYKRAPKGSPECTPGNPAYMGECVGIPTGLKFIAGFDFVSGTVNNGQTLFKCVAPNGANRSGFYSDMTQALAFCQNGDVIDLFADSSECWDGVNLDSANHRSHMANLVNGKCPSTHPKLLPHFTIQQGYLVTDGWNKTGTWTAGMQTAHFASDEMPGMPPMRPGSSYHFDYAEGWNPWVRKAWTDNCIDRKLNCSAGDLGNGYQLKQESPLVIENGQYVANPPRYVNVPAGIRGPFLNNRLHGTH